MKNKFADLLNELVKVGQNAVNVFDTPGGHVFVCLALLIYFQRMGTGSLAHDISIFALGVLSRSMGSARDVVNAVVNRGPNGEPDGSASVTVSQAGATATATTEDKSE